MGTIYDYPDLDNTSLQSHADQCYVLVHDAFINPDGTFRCSMDRIADFAPTELAPVSPVTLAGTERYMILVNSSNVANTVTVPNTQECLITNTSQNATNLVVITTGNSNQTLSPGQSLQVQWDGAAHDLTISSSAAVITLDDTVTTSSNAVKSSGIKTYADAISTNLTALSTDHDLRAIVRAGDEVVVGTGNATTDATNLGNAISALNTAGKGTLWIAGEVKLNSGHMFTIPPRIRPLTTDAAIRVVADTAYFACGSFFVPISSAATDASPAPCAINATGALAEQFTITNPAYAFTATDTNDLFTATGHTFVNGNRVVLSGGSLPGGFAAGTTYYVRDLFGDTFKLAATAGGSVIPVTADGSGTITGNLILTIGDWVALWSEDEITGVTPHHYPTAGAKDYPMELHQIKRVDGSNTYSVGETIIDALVTNPRVRIVPMLTQPGGKAGSDALIEGLAFRQDDGVENTELFAIRCLNGVVFDRCHWQMTGTAGAPGQVHFQSCANIRVTDCISDGMELYNISSKGYWWEFGLVNTAIVDRITARRSRHSVDTTGAYDSSPYRYGTPRGVRCVNSQFFCEGDASIGTLAPCSTHSSGYGVVYEGNTFHISGAAVGGYALTARGRHTVFRNNTLIGGAGGCRGVIASAVGCIIEGNYFENVWRAVLLQTTGSALPDDCVFKDNTMINCVAAGIIHILDGSGHKILNNLFQDSGQCCIEVEGLTFNNEIAHNTFVYPAASGTQAVISYSVTGTDSAHNINIHHNTFIDANEIAIEFLGCGDENRIEHNVFHRCGNNAEIIKIVAGKKHRICQNEINNELEDAIACTATNGTDYITASGNTTVSGSRVVFSIAGVSSAMPSGLTEGTIYYVRDKNGSDFKVEASPGSGAINFTTDGSGLFVRKYANTSSINVGSNAPIAISVDTGTDVVTATGHTYENGNPIVFATTGSLPGGISAATIYYVRDKATNNFKVAKVPGGGAIDITSAGSSSTVTEVCEVKILGNVADGYGSGSLGLTGTLASTFNTAFAARNTTD